MYTEPGVEALFGGGFAPLECGLVELRRDGGGCGAPRGKLGRFAGGVDKLLCCYGGCAGCFGVTVLLSAGVAGDVVVYGPQEAVFSVDPLS